LAQLLAWGLRQWRQAPILTTFSIMSAAAVATCFGGPVSAASATSVQSAAGLMVLADTTSAGVGVLANAVMP
jgi:hypothetical protein